MLDFESQHIFQAIYNDDPFSYSIYYIYGSDVILVVYNHHKMYKIEEIQNQIDFGETISMVQILGLKLAYSKSTTENLQSTCENSWLPFMKTNSLDNSAEIRRYSDRQPSEVKYKIN